MKTNSSRSITKIVYILSLVGILCLLLIYFDIIQNSSLFEIVSMILGFIFCLLIQFKVIEHYFSKEMKELNLNQFAIIKEKIRSIMFGELNPKYIDKKNKIKYYSHTNDKEDRLFNEENSQTYESVMAHLRAQNEIQHITKIRSIKEKWKGLKFKIQLIERFLASLYKIYKERGNIFKNFEQKALSKSKEETDKWFILFNENLTFAPKKQTNEFFMGYNLSKIGWKQLNTLIEERMKMNKSKTKQISQKVIQQFSFFSEDMKTRNKEKIQKLEELDTQYALRKRKHKEVVDNIQFLKKKIDEIVRTIKQNKIKSSENVQLVFQNEYELRMKNIQLENYQVKKTYTYDMCLKQSEILYQRCDEQEKWLQNQALKSLNKKLATYLKIMLDQEERLHQKIKRYNTENKTVTIFEDFISRLTQDNVELFYGKHKEIERRFNSFRVYLKDLLNLYEELEVNFAKTDEIIEDFQKQLQYGYKNSNNHDNLNDRKFLSIMKTINNKEKLIIQETKICFLRQQEELNECQRLKAQGIRIFLDLNKKYEKSQSLKRNPENLEMKDQLAKEIVQIFYAFSKIKMDLYLHESLQTFLMGQLEIYKLFEDQVESISRKIQSEDYEIDVKQEKMNRYNDQLFKIQLNELEENPKKMFEEKNDENEELKKQNEIRSLKILNKLLNVFVEEWSNSHFFHSLIKEQLEISLNRKRPSLVSYIQIKYFKIEQKYEDLIDGINVHGQEIFKCLFDATINFKGKIVIHIETQLLLGNKVPINIKVMVKEFKCPIKICFTPYSLGKSYGSLLQIPKLSIELNAQVGKWNLQKIPFISILLKTFIVIKLRKKLLWPKRFTLSVPMAVKSPINLATRERAMFEKQLEKKKQKMK